ncbi:MAG: transketolase [Nitrospira sp.]|nr:transketolase [Nitrospira sp.]
MRNAFASELTALAAGDDRIVLLSGDIGNQLFEDYKRKAPRRFFNCGVAEANMMGVAAGLAGCGLKPITYTITPFMTTRCLEQIRVDVCYQNLPVIIVGVGGGLSYASLNATHHSCEDIAFLRMLPNMTVVCPGDPLEVRQALRAALDINGPVYLRLGKKGEPLVHSQLTDFKIGKAIVLQEGEHVCLLSTGNILPVAVQAAALLAKDGITARVVSMHTVKPLDVALLSDVFDRFPLVATLEEHSVLGGLGGSVAEWLADRGHGYARLLRIGTADAFMYVAGEQDFAREYFGLTAESIATRVRNLYRQTTLKASSTSLA